MIPFPRQVDPRLKAILCDWPNQAQFPERGTHFETQGLAEHAASEAIGPENEWKTQKVAINSETFYVIKYWPKGRSSICTERRWAAFVKPHSKRKNHGTEDGDEAERPPRTPRGRSNYSHGDA